MKNNRKKKQTTFSLTAEMLISLDHICSIRETSQKMKIACIFERKYLQLAENSYD